VLDYDFDQWQHEKNWNAIQGASRELRFPYQIDFVTEAGLPEFIAKVEMEVAAVVSENWPEPALEGAGRE